MIRSRDVLIWLASDTRENFTASDVAKALGTTVKIAGKKLQRLHQWGCLRIVDRTRPKLYRVTPWGRKCLTRWRGNSGD
jgi:predicted ArsR family transcriptional regulator